MGTYVTSTLAVQCVSARVRLCIETKLLAHNPSLIRGQVHLDVSPICISSLRNAKFVNVSFLSCVQFDRPGSYNNFSSYPPGPVTLPGGATPTGGAGPDGFHAHHHKAAPASLSSVGTGSSADGSAGLGPQPGPAGASAASPPFVPQNAVGGPGYPPHMHGGPLMSPPAGGNPLRTPGSGTAAGGFWSADSPAADIPLGNASTAELMQQLAMRTAAAGGGGGGFDDRGAFSPQFGSPTAAGYGAAVCRLMSWCFRFCDL